MVKAAIVYAVPFVILILYLGLSFVANTSAQSSELTTPSNVTINKYLAIALSTNLSTGITFGSVNINTTDNNATHNFDGNISGNLTGATSFINISVDSNINVDICIRDNVALNTTGGDIIGNGNYTWIDNRTSNSSHSQAGNSYPIATTYQRTNVTNSPPNSAVYFRFWLDIPNRQAAGTYNNTVYFKAVENTVACGS